MLRLLLLFYLHPPPTSSLTISATGSRPTGLYQATSYGGKSGLIITAKPTNHKDLSETNQEQRRLDILDHTQEVVIHLKDVNNIFSYVIDITQRTGGKCDSEARRSLCSY